MCVLWRWRGGSLRCRRHVDEAAITPVIVAKAEAADSAAAAAADVPDVRGTERFAKGAIVTDDDDGPLVRLDGVELAPRRRSELRLLQPAVSLIGLQRRTQGR